MRSLDVIGKRRFRLFRSARGGLGIFTPDLSNDRLLEDGFFRLLESGFNRALESGVAAYPLFMENNTALLIEDGSELYLG